MVQKRLRRVVLPAAITAVAATVAITGTVLLGGNADADTVADPAALVASAAKAAANAGKPVAGRKINTRSLRAALSTDEAKFGDLTGDGKADLAAVDAAGIMWVYPGKGYVYDPSSGGTRSKTLFGARFKVGPGWSKFTSIIRHGDFNGDGKQDVLTRGATGNLSLYTGTGKTPGVVSGKGLAAGTGWNGFNSITGAGDLNGDKRDDVLAQKPNGDLMLYTGTNLPSHPFAARGTRVGTGFKGDLLTNLGDFTGDGLPEFAFRNTAGIVYQYDSKPGLNPIGTRHVAIDDTTVGKYLKNMVGPGDITSDTDRAPATPDWLWQGSDGTLFLIAQDVATHTDDDVVVGTGWKSYRLF
jgi:hypothetical protein